MSIEKSSGNNKIPHLAPPPEAVESERMAALAKVGLIAVKFAENQESFARRTDIVGAYKGDVGIDLATIPRLLSDYYKKPQTNLGNLALNGFYGNAEGIFHKILRVDLDLSQYPSNDPDWGKIRECAHEAAELIRSVAHTARCLCLFNL